MNRPASPKILLLAAVFAGVVPFAPPIAMAQECSNRDSPLHRPTTYAIASRHRTFVQSVALF